MEFPVSPVELPDCQLNWEFLKKKIVDTKGLGAGGITSMTFGQSTITFTASVNSAVLTVSHGLGVIPVFVGPVGVVPAGAPNFAVDAYVEIGSYNISTFKLFGISHTATTGSVTIPWLAIG